MELAGRVIAFWNRKAVSSRNGNEWKVQEYVIETTTSIRVACALMSLVTTKSKQFNIQVGEELNVSFDIDARQWQGRWFNSIRAWKVERVEPLLRCLR